MSLHPKLQAIDDRWAGFVVKVRARLAEIEAEADAAYREVVAVEEVTGYAVSGVSSAVTARMHGVRERVEEAFSKLDSDLDAVGEELDDARLCGRFRGALLIKKGDFDLELEVRRESLVYHGEAMAAQALGVKAQEEIRAPLACSHCGGPLQRPLSAYAVNVPCPSCRSLTTATPGTAAAMYLSGGAGIQLAFHGALPQWIELKHAERAWHRWRHPTTDDYLRWAAANRAYWTAFSTIKVGHTPGLTDEARAAEIEAEVVGKMGHMERFQADQDRVPRDRMQRGLAAVAAGDAGALAQWGKSEGGDSSLAENLVFACIERGWRDHATWAATVLHPVCAPRESKNEWVREVVDDASYYAEAWGK